MRFLSQPRVMLIGRLTVVALLALVAVIAVGAHQPASAASGNGAAGQMPAFFNGQQFTINFKEQPSEGVLVQRNQVNTIYMCACAPMGKPFVSVIDEIQGQGFNPLWNEVDITFNTGQTPVQFTSATDIKTSNAITLKTTLDVYRCSVVGPGPK